MPIRAWTITKAPPDQVKISPSTAFANARFWVQQRVGNDSLMYNKWNHY